MNENLKTIIKAAAAGGLYGLCAFAYSKLTRVVTVDANVNIPNRTFDYPIWCGEFAERGDRVIHKGHIWQCVSICTFSEPDEDNGCWRMIDDDLAMQRGY